MRFKKRFDMKDELLHMISFFDPEKVLSPRTRQIMPSLGPLIRSLPHIYTGIEQELDDEWRYLDVIDLSNFCSTKTGIVPFYQNLGSFKEGDQFYFKNLSKFALQVLSLPVSNVDAERLFSKLNLVKTDTRNRLGIKSLKSLLHISEAVKEHEACYLYQPTEAVLKCFE